MTRKEMMLKGISTYTLLNFSLMKRMLPEWSLKEIKDTLKTGTWKLLGFTVGVIGLIVSIIVTVAVTLIK